ncbi:MAG: PAS domain-containing protein [Chloroflexota bacterium]
MKDEDRTKKKVINKQKAARQPTEGKPSESGYKPTEETLSKGHNELETRVEERTRELAEANERLRNEVAERNRMEAALKDSQQLLSSFMNSATDGFALLDAKLNYVEVNQAWVKMFDWPMEEAIGQNILDVAPRLSQTDTYQQYLEVIRTGKPYNADVLLAQAKSGDKYLAIRAFKVGDGLGAILTDITNYKRAEAALRESEENYRALAESGGDGISVHDYDGRFLYANPALAKFLNKEPADVIGRTFRELVPEEAARFRTDTIRRAFHEGKTVRVENAGGPRENPRYYSVTVAPIYDKDGKVGSAVTIVRDITERKKSEEKLKESYAQEVKLRQELEAANRAKSEFYTGMSHELRTPLNSVICFSELMVDGATGEINDEQRRCLEDILTSGRHLLALIDDVLDLSKIEAGKLKLGLENVNLADVASEALTTMQPMLDENQHRLTFNLEKNLPRVRADKYRLRQVLINLLSNANKFTPPGGQIGIEAHSQDGWCRVSISDTGIGIRKKDHQRIFEPFTQAGSLPDRVKRGTGLGLSLTREFVEAWGGQIWMESEYGQGSKFIFTLPLVKEKR